MRSKLVPRKLDKSSDYKLTANDSMIDAINVRAYDYDEGTESTGSSGVIKNPRSNMYVHGQDNLDLSTGEFSYLKVIGSVTDNKAKITYFFVWNANGNHMIMAYDKYGRLPKIDADGNVTFQKNSQHLIYYRTGLLEFKQDGFVKGDVVHINKSSFKGNQEITDHLKSIRALNDMSSDAILYFTDNNSEPKKINVYRAIIDGYTQIISTPQDEQLARDFISACPRTPLDRIVGSFGYDENINVSNFVNTPGFQFAYQWVYKDGFESAISVYSDIVVPKRRLNQGALTNIDDEYNNVINLHIPKGTSEVEYIKIISREGDTGSFLEIDVVKRNEDTVYNGVNIWDSTQGVYKFYNNKVSKAISTELVNKQYDDLPRVAQGQAVSNNRLFYGNYVSGFDNVEINATITPVYNELPSGDDLGVTIHPRVRASIDNFPGNPTAFAVASNSTRYPAGASYMLDFSNVQSLQPDSTVRIFMKVSPDKNFHVFKNNKILPALNHQTAEQFASGQDQFTAKVADVIHKHENAGISLNYKQYTSTGNIENLNLKIGAHSSAPLIIQSQHLTFEVEFTWRGEAITDGADLLIADLFTFFITQVPSLTQDELANGLNYSDPEAWYLNELSYDYIWNDVIDQITVKTSSNVSYDLELNHLDVITAGVPTAGYNSDGSAFNGSGSADQRCYLIFPLVESGDTMGIPRGYGILNSINCDFKIDYVNKSNNGKVREFMLQLYRISDMSLFTCCSRPTDNRWFVLDPESMQIGSGGSTNGKISELLNAAGISTNYGLDGFFNHYTGATPQGVTFNIENYGFTNDEINKIKSQFGTHTNNFSSVTYFAQTSGEPLTPGPTIPQAGKYWKLVNGQFVNELHPPSSDNFGSWCVYDGESGIGGKGVNGTPYSTMNFSVSGSLLKLHSYFNYSDLQLSSDINGSAWGLRRCIGGMYFNGCNWRLTLRPFLDNQIQEVSGDVFIKGLPSYMPLLKSGIDYDETINVIQSQPQPLHNNFIITYDEYIDVTSDSFNAQHTRPQVEYVSFIADYFGLDTGENYRSFKSDSYHDFGIVYYDERGRHGFVNNAGNIYVNGYSDAERGPNKGSVYMKFDINSDPPTWAKRWKVVHSGSTSVDTFIQYTSGGAFIRPNVSSDDTNLYISLNYLQYSQVSYSSAFGARDPEGGILLYNFQQGDKLRIISYETGGEVEYPKNYEFDIIDAKFLESGDNPLHDSDDTPPFNKMGQFLIVKNNADAINFSHSSIEDESDFWGNNCIIEIYRPYKNRQSIVYREIGPTFGVNHNGETPQQKHGTPVVIEDGDVWFRRMAVNKRDYIGGEYVDLLVDNLSDSGTNTSTSNFKNHFLESKTSTDLVKGDSIGLGRPNIILQDTGEIRNESSITYSDPTASSSKTVRYSSFNNALLNFKDLDRSYGDIRFLIDKGDHLLVILEDKCVKIPVGRQILSTASGNNMITSSTNVLNDAIFYNGIAGCGDHPESVVIGNESVYFAHNGLGKVFRLDGDGIMEISDLGVDHYIKKLLTSNINQGSYRKAISGFDNFNNEYLLTVRDITRLVGPGDDPYDSILNYGCGEEGTIPIFECSTLNSVTVITGGGTTSITDQEGTDVTEEDGGTTGTNVYGCTDPSACNFNSDATSDDGSCTYALPGYDCDGTQTIVSNYGPNEGDKKLADYVAANGLKLKDLSHISFANNQSISKSFVIGDFNNDGGYGSADLLIFLATYAGQGSTISADSTILPPTIDDPGDEYDVVNHPNVLSGADNIIHVLAWTQETTNDLHGVIQQAYNFLSSQAENSAFIGTEDFNKILFSIHTRPDDLIQSTDLWEGYVVNDLLYFLGLYNSTPPIIPSDSPIILIPL